MKRLYLLFRANVLLWILLLGNTISKADNDTPQQTELAKLDIAVASALEGISSEAIAEYTRMLSSRQFQGREAGSHGARRSAKYIIQQFRGMGLLPGGNAGSYFRTFKIESGQQIVSSLEIKIGQTQVIDDLQRSKDYMPIHIPQKQVEVSAKCVLIGYGITSKTLNFDEYQGIDARGKAVIIFSGTPWDRDTREWIHKLPEHKLLDTIEYKVQNAEQHGASCVLLVDNPVGWRNQLDVPEKLRIPDVRFPMQSKIPVVHITRELLQRITLLSEKEIQFLARDIARDQSPQPMRLSSRHLTLKASISGRAWIGRNVVGVLPGSDPQLKKQAVIIGAHYDHLGEGIEDSVFFGANDNASGVSAVLSVAKAFTSLPKAPKRTLIFITFDAEEIGLIGSRSYIRSPIITSEQTALMINFDMVGRNGDNHIFAVATKSSLELHEIHQQANQYIGLDLTHPNSFRLGLSDHTHFYYAGIPIMYLFGGLDEDYHTPQDTWDKLLPNKIAKVAGLAFLTALQVAQRQEKIQLAKREE